MGNTSAVCGTTVAFSDADNSRPCHMQSDDDLHEIRHSIDNFHKILNDMQFTMLSLHHENGALHKENRGLESQNRRLQSALDHGTIDSSWAQFDVLEKHYQSLNERGDMKDRACSSPPGLQLPEVKICLDADDQCSQTQWNSISTPRLSCQRSHEFEYVHEQQLAHLNPQAAWKSIATPTPTARQLALSSDAFSWDWPQSLPSRDGAVLPIPLPVTDLPGAWHVSTNCSDLEERSLAKRRVCS